MFVSPGPIALEIGPLQIRWYGILIAIGIIAAYNTAAFFMKRAGKPIEILEKIFFWTVGGGVIGARLYEVIFNSRSYISDPLEIFKIWHGGLAIHGALLGGLAGLAFVLVRNKQNIIAYTDLFMPGVLLAQGIGRWGNFFNSEAFGTPADLPWKLFIPLENRPAGFEAFDFFHPTFLYESLWNFAGFAVLFFIALRRPPRGIVTGVYLVWYSIGRFLIESIRTDSFYIGEIRVAQAVSVLLLIGGLILLLMKSRRVAS